MRGKLKRWLLGLFHSQTRIEAREGEYKNVFCPHCGAFIPERFHVHPGGFASDESMLFDCPECERGGAVMETYEYEPLVDPPELKRKENSLLSDESRLIDLTEGGDDGSP